MPMPASVPQYAKRWFNPYVLPVAERLAPFAVVEHSGRRSHRAYRTPVVALARRRAGGGVDAVFALPYGPGVDWARNGQAAGGFALVRKHVRYRLDDLRLVHGDEALALLPWGVRHFLGALGTEDVLLARVRRA